MESFWIYSTNTGWGKCQQRNVSLLFLLDSNGPKKGQLFESVVQEDFFQGGEISKELLFDSVMKQNKKGGGVKHERK